MSYKVTMIEDLISKSCWAIIRRVPVFYFDIDD